MRDGGVKESPPSGTMVAGDYEFWRQTTLQDLEHHGHQETLTWLLMLGAMAELGGRKPQEARFVESWITSTNKVFTVFRAWPRPEQRGISGYRWRVPGGTLPRCWRTGAVCFSHLRSVALTSAFPQEYLCNETSHGMLGL